MADIWFSSDWHYGHTNIVSGTSSWPTKEACRNFQTLEEHNEALVNNINACAKKNDTVFFGGDFSFGGKQNIYEFWKRLNCKNIHFIGGNHDHHIRKNAMLDVEGVETPAKSLFLSYNELVFKRIGTERFVLCHYALRTWENGHHGAIMLYGHSHGSLPDYTMSLPVNVSEANGTPIKSMVMPIKFKSMDIGIDTHPEFRPYNIDEIKAAMTNRIPLRVDHHDEITN